MSAKQLLPAFVKIGRQYFRLRDDALPENRVVVSLLGATGNCLGPAFVYEAHVGESERLTVAEIRAKVNAAAEVSEADARQVLFCQHVMTVLVACDSPYCNLLDAFQVDIHGPLLTGTGTLAWRSGKVPLKAVASRIVPDLDLVRM